MSASMGLSSGSVDRNGVRYWWMVYGISRAIEKIKSSCVDRGIVDIESFTYTSDPSDHAM